MKTKPLVLPAHIKDYGSFLQDTNNFNRNYYGNSTSIEIALANLLSLVDCFDCTDCVRCTECKDCFDCADCKQCYAEAHKVGWVQSSPSVAKSRFTDTPLPIPVVNNINTQILGAVSGSGEQGLNMGQWHTCETTHCIAGWAIHLAGPEGYKLESRVGTNLAAQLIFRASGSPIDPMKFYESINDALVNLRARAELETQS